MDFRGVMPRSGKLLTELGRPMLRARKDQRRAMILGQQHLKHVRLALRRDKANLLLDLLGSSTLRGNFNRLGRLHVVLGERSNVLCHSGREQHGLTVSRQQRGDTPDSGDKAHVEHTIRFVQNEGVDIVQMDRALLDMVLKQPGVSDYK